jgi:hypothetical protein
MTRYAPLWIQQQQYPAALDRRLIGTLWPNGGCTGCAVAPQGGNLTCTIQPGQIAVPTQNGTGATLCISDAVELVVLPNAPGAGLNRIDLIICQPQANDIDGGTNNQFIFVSVTGTPAASPTVPAAPAGSFVLAQVAVNATVTALVAANFTDRRAQPIVPLSHPYSARMYRQAAINGTGGAVAMPYDNVSYDPNGNLVVGAGAAYHCPVTGKYIVTGRSSVGNPTAQTRMFMSIMKNGAEYARGSDSIGPASTSLAAQVTDIVPANIGDTLSGQVFQQTSNGFDVGPILNYMSFALLTSP